MKIKLGWQASRPRSHYREMNKDPELPLSNRHREPIVIGCNYHTTWQRRRGMRFVLSDVSGQHAHLSTRGTMRHFKCNLDDLIFIKSPYNIEKGESLRPKAFGI